VLGERLTAQVLIGAALVLASVAALLSVSYAESRLGRRDT